MLTFAVGMATGAALVVGGVGCWVGYHEWLNGWTLREVVTGKRRRVVEIRRLRARHTREWWLRRAAIEDGPVGAGLPVRGE